MTTMHKIRLTVRYAETDKMGVVYYANYLVWFEVVRTSFLKSRGISYKDLEDEKGLYLMVVESQCKHKHPATYDDELTIETWVSELKNSSLAFNYKVLLTEKIIAEGKTRHVFTNREGRPVKIPQYIKAVFE